MGDVALSFLLGLLLGGALMWSILSSRYEEVITAYEAILRRYEDERRGDE